MCGGGGVGGISRVKEGSAREGERGGGGEGERESVCVCVCERERSRIPVASAFPLRHCSERSPIKLPQPAL